MARKRISKRISKKRISKRISKKRISKNNLGMSSNITMKKFNAIKEKYGHMSSWAIWGKQLNPKKPKDNMGDISFFEKPDKELLKKLNPNIILVGLNISKEIDRKFGNFHPYYSSAQDYKTRFAVKDTIIWGAYMTDIIKDFSEKVSGKMMKYLKENKDFEKENIVSFEQELKDIGAKNPILIAMGNDTEKILKRNLKDKYKIYKVTHYSAFIKKEKLKEGFDNVIKNII